MALLVYLVGLLRVSVGSGHGGLIAAALLTHRLHRLRGLLLLLPVLTI